MEKFKVTVERDSHKLAGLYVDLFFYEKFYNSFNEIMTDLTNKELQRFGLKFGRGGSHIWISDINNNVRFVIITER